MKLSEPGRVNLELGAIDVRDMISLWLEKHNIYVLDPDRVELRFEPHLSCGSTEARMWIDVPAAATERTASEVARLRNDPVFYGPTTFEPLFPPRP